jgi:hypothetical protein
MKLNLSIIKQWSLKKKIGYGFLAIIILGGMFSGGGKNSDDLLKEISNSKDKSEISKLSDEFKKVAEINDNDFVSCRSSCSQKATSINVTDVKTYAKSRPFRGKVFSQSKSHGADMKLSNLSYDKSSKISTLKLGSEVKTFDSLLLSVTRFDVAGVFIENHMMNHDVDGIVTAYTIDENKLNQIKQAAIKKEKQEADKMKMTVLEYRSYEDKVKFCRKDWKKCVDNAMLVNKYSGMAKVKAACQVEANSRATYGKPDWSWVTFGTYYTGNRYIKSGLVEVVDNTVKFQNGYGAMKKQSVSCVYDLNQNKITALSIR